MREKIETNSDIEWNMWQGATQKFLARLLVKTLKTKWKKTPSQSLRTILCNKMGSWGSKPKAEVTGDKDLTIIQNQEVHTEHHMVQDFKTTLLIVLIAILLTERLVKYVYKFLVAQAKRSAERLLTVPK